MLSRGSEDVFDGGNVVVVEVEERAERCEEEEMDGVDDGRWSVHCTVM